MTKIGILHPGEMGISIAVSAINSGHQVHWISRGRSEKSFTRAEKYHLTDTESLWQLCQTCEVIICICPPHGAEDVAKSVIERGFQGCYLDANAISPQRAIKVGQMMEANGIHFIDGGIIGGPAWKPNETRLFLSGKYSSVVAGCFSKGPLETKVVGEEIGKASALKMCYAAYSKGTTALLAGILAAAESLGVRDELYQQWDMDDSNFSNQANRRVTRVTAKAWRFEGEMHEIAFTFQEAGLPNGFHEAAAEIYHRMAGFKDSSEIPQLSDVLNSLLTDKKRP
jgi:3-hydroxyisobutyrate dehydrogenase-like beta-hydroxyacid dehydrogenase